MTTNNTQTTSKKTRQSRKRARLSRSTASHLNGSGRAIRSNGRGAQLLAHSAPIPRAGLSPNRRLWGLWRGTWLPAAGKKALREALKNATGRFLSAFFPCFCVVKRAKTKGRAEKRPVFQRVPRGAAAALLCAALALPARLAAEEKNFAESRPGAADREELSISLSGADVELDFRKSYIASEAQLFTGLYEGLFSYHPLTMEPVPAVAASWKLSDDKKQWTFTIREGARYWNNDAVKAADFRAGWLSSLELGDASPYSSLFDIIEGARDYRLGVISDASKVGILAPDDRTLIVKLTAPTAFFPSILCHHSFSPLHPSMAAVEDWSKKPPVSNGPFYLTENTGAQKVLLRSEAYWDRAEVALKKITVKYPESGEEASAMWNSGEVRWLAGGVSLDALTDRSGIEINPMFATHYYFIRSARKPWNDWRLRRALAISLPWAEMRKEYLLPAKTLVYPIPGYPEIAGLDKTDLTEAKKLLKESGHNGGKGLPELVIRLTPSEEAARIGAIMASTWKEKLGVPVKIEVLSYDNYFSSLRGNDYDVAASTWIGDFADPYTFLQMWRKDSNLNDARHNDSDYEALIDTSMTQEGGKRWKTLSEAETLLLDRGVVLPIYYSYALNIIDTSEIDGWFRNVLDIHPFKYLSFKDYRPLPGVVYGKRL